MLIHFICTGNTYRSRLAEAYLRSKKIPELQIISSGVEAFKNLNGPITWEADRLLKRNNLVPFMTAAWTQTTSGLLNKSDMIIFMDSYGLEYCRKHFSFDGENYQVWNLPNIDELEYPHHDSMNDETKRILDSERTFDKIKEKADTFILELKHSKIL